MGEESEQEEKLLNKLRRHGREDLYWMAKNEASKYPQKDVSIQIRISAGIILTSREKQPTTEQSIVILRFKREFKSSNLRLYAIESAGRFQDSAVLPEMKKIAYGLLNRLYPTYFSKSMEITKTKEDTGGGANYNQRHDTRVLDETQNAINARIKEAEDAGLDPAMLF